MLISISIVFLPVCVALCTWWGVVAPLYAEFCLYTCTHKWEHLLSPCDTLTDVALCLILCSIWKPVWFLQTGIYDFLPLRGTGFNACSNSILHIKGQLFYNWKMEKLLTSLLLFSLVCKVDRDTFACSVRDCCELHIQEVSMI